MKKYDFIEHTADIKFKVWGKSLNEIFENCALAVSEIIGREDKIKDKIKKEIELKGKDNEELLYGFIDELIYLLDAENFVISKAEVEVKEGSLKGIVYGDDVSNYNDLDHVKAATYADMYVREVKGKWEAQVVVDV